MKIFQYISKNSLNLNNHEKIMEIFQYISKIPYIFINLRHY